MRCAGNRAGQAYWLSEKEVVVFRLNAEILENRIGPESLHIIPVLDLSMTNRVVHTVAGAISSS